MNILKNSSNMILFAVLALAASVPCMQGVPDSDGIEEYLDRSVAQLQQPGGQGVRVTVAPNAAQQEKCLICAEGDHLIRLRCDHTVHARCIIQWFKLQRARNQPFTCPSCRASIYAVNNVGVVAGAPRNEAPVPPVDVNEAPVMVSAAGNSGGNTRCRNCCTIL
jgi:hypothetical protein